MAIVAGIDEAGYGPALGPLVASVVIFRMPDALAHADLWAILKETCTNIAGKPGRKLVIADSKKLKRRDGDIQLLEQTALVMLAALAAKPENAEQFLGTVAPDAPTELAEYPWYSCSDIRLPIQPGKYDVGTKANAVRRQLMEQGIELVGVRSVPLAEGHFNRLIIRTRNKAAVLCGLALRLMQHAMSLARREPVLIHVDRLGGRTHYRDMLMTSWPQHELRILEESDERSAYHLCHEESPCDIDFLVGGERRHFPVALASIFSKYLREILMHAFNRYWSAQLCGLTPTAGYYTDAQRWLRDAQPVLERLRIDREMLVRAR